MIPIKGFIETSFSDWDGKISSVIFLAGCNFRCPYCHNATLVVNPDSLPDLSYKKIKDFLVSHRDWIDGVVISGGEPTLYEKLTELIKEIKEMGFLIKLDTNGSNPQRLRDLIGQKLLNYVAMDLNAPLDEKYHQLSGTTVNLEKIKESMNLLLESKIDYEFRTTVVPNLLDEEDIAEIASSIQGAKNYVLQQFNPKETLDPSLRKVAPYPKEKLQQMVARAKDFVANVHLRGI